MKRIAPYLEVSQRDPFFLVRGRLSLFLSSGNRVNGRAFSKMKLAHIDRMGVSFGSRILIEKLLEDIVSRSV